MDETKPIILNTPPIDTTIDLNIPLSTNNTQPIVSSKQELSTDPNRDSKGQFVAGNTSSVGNDGRPCGYCLRKVEIDEYMRKYLELIRAKDKLHIPYIEEIAMDLQVHSETVLNWTQKRNNIDGIEVLEHPEFFEAIKKVKDIQKYRLLQRTLGRFNPTGAIFQLKVNHGYVETEKRIIAGSPNEPLQIEVIEDKRTDE